MGARLLRLLVVLSAFSGGCSERGSPSLTGGQSGTDSNDYPPPCAGTVFTPVPTDRCIESIGWSADAAWTVFEGSYELTSQDGGRVLTLEIRRGSAASFTNQMGSCGVLRLEVDASVRAQSGTFEVHTAVLDLREQGIAELSFSGAGELEGETGVFLVTVTIDSTAATLAAAVCRTDTAPPSCPESWRYSATANLAGSACSLTGADAGADSGDF
jgi:hypothetical protein